MMIESSKKDLIKLNVKKTKSERTKRSGRTLSSDDFYPA